MKVHGGLSDNDLQTGFNSFDDCRNTSPWAILRYNPQRPHASRHVAHRTEVFDNAGVKGSEFLRKVKVVAKRYRLPFRWVAERGSGSHGTLYVGERFTVVKDLKKELGPGLLSDMLKQLGIRKEDL